MPEFTDLTPLAPWRAIIATREDWASLDRTRRYDACPVASDPRFEEKVLDLAGQDWCMDRRIPLSAGGRCRGSARPADKRSGQRFHRAHHQFLAKALSYVACLSGCHTQP